MPVTERLRTLLHEAVGLAAHSYPALASAVLQGAGHVPGDYLEFGVYKGDSLLKIDRYVKEVVRLYGANNGAFENLRTMRFFGFDSFQGFPKPAAIDQVAGQAEWFKEGALACSEQDVRKRLVRGKMDMSKVHLVKGFFNETLTPETKARLGLEKASLVLMDADFYESTRDALEFITDLLVDGTIIIFDNWWMYRGHPDKGEHRAFTEWTEKHRIRHSEFIRTTSMSFIVHK
jgi:hypothetical protein